MLQEHLLQNQLFYPYLKKSRDEKILNHGFVKQGFGTNFFYKFFVRMACHS